MTKNKQAQQNVKKTIASYNAAGSAYLSRTYHLTPPTRASFAKLLPPRARILDVGCAGGRDSRAFYKLGFRVTGIDVSSVLLKFARRYAPKIHFLKMDARALKFPQESFEAIWANASLLHVPRYEIPHTLKDFHRLLVPGGKLHLLVKYGRGDRFVTEGYLVGRKRWFVFFTLREMTRLVRDAGFKIIKQETTQHAFRRTGNRWVLIWAEKPHPNNPTPRARTRPGKNSV